jgi:glycosyltransferase involved in cell wall biosynthesis
MKAVIIQPFYDWKGHYKKYTDEISNVFEEKICLLAGVKKDSAISDDITAINNQLDKSKLHFLFFRLFNPLLCAFYSLGYLKQKSVLIAIEFNPFTYLLYSFFSKVIGFKYIQIVHNLSPDRKNISLLKACYLNLNEILFRFIESPILIVHSQSHYDNLLDIRKVDCRSIHIEYPTEGRQITTKQLNEKTDSPLIFSYVGLIRKDKDMKLLADFCRELKNITTKDYVVNVAGYPKDYTREEIYEMFEGIPNVNFNLKYLTESELKNLLLKSHFFLLPYNDNHSSTIGPLKLAFSYGLVCIGSNSKMFKIKGAPSEAILSYMGKKSGKSDMLDSIYSTNKAKEILKFAQENDWSNFAGQILHIAKKCV